GVIYTIGDTLKIGQPLSHLGWVSIFSYTDRDSYIKNKNLINKSVVITNIDTLYKPVNFTFDFYNKQFYVNIDHALQNKEVFPKFESESAKSGFQNINTTKYELLIQLKELLDINAITRKEYEAEKKKILKQDN
ncbi:MAG: SHOCT domain-containing protein, partial [Saprospiraceae bacterium]|nr:SHOCT domain-containing protein [Flavobacteriaceae bacterium]NNE25728.1 SHOCT domain-containing protein [Saprospiraceae bacterium]